MVELVAKIALLSLLIFLFIGNPTHANDSELFLKGIKGIVKLNFLDGSNYQGQVKDCPIKLNCMHGIGVYVRGGSTYLGKFISNKPNGKGLFIHEDGQSYDGFFKNGRLHGKGIMIYLDGRQYEGEYKNNKRNGYGVMTYQEGGKYLEGSRYEGEWVNDKRNGQGVMIYPYDSRRLQGEFKEDVFIDY